MICLYNVSWKPTKGFNRTITALKMLFGLSYNLPLDTKTAEQLSSFIEKGNYHRPPFSDEKTIQA